MHIEITDGSDSRFIKMCNKLDDYLDNLKGWIEHRKQYAKHKSLVNIHDVILIMDNDKVIACGSFQERSDGVAEIKRICVVEEYRGQDYGHIIMNELEKLAKSKGYSKLLLETGEILKRAMALYINQGFKIIDNYEPYINMVDSICMEKLI